MKKLFFVVAVISFLAFYGIIEAGSEPDVKIGDIKLKLTSVEVKKGFEIIFPEEKKEKGDMPFPPIDPSMFGEDLDKSSLSYIDWINFGQDYILLKFEIEGKEAEGQVYVSPASRYGCSVETRDDGGNILNQARLFPDMRPDCCIDPGVFRIDAKKGVKDALIVKAPEESAKNVKIMAFLDKIMPETGGTLTIDIPFIEGKPKGLGDIKLKYEEPVTESKKKLRKSRKAKVGRVEFTIEDVVTRNLSLYNTEIGMVYTDTEQHMLVRFSAKNKNSKAVKYKPVVLQDKLPGIAVDHQGQICSILSLPEGLKVIEAFDLKEEIPGRGEITDYMIIDAPAGCEAIRIVMIPEGVLPDEKGNSGIVMFLVKFEDGVPSEVRSAVMKKSISITEDSLVSVLDSAKGLYDEKWDLKYCGLLVNGCGKLAMCEYDPEGDYSYLTLISSENAVSGNSYGYIILMPGNKAFSQGEEVAFKGVLITQSQEEADGVARKWLIVYGMKALKTNR